MSKRVGPEEYEPEPDLFAKMDRMFERIEFDPPGPMSGKILNPPGVTMADVQRLYLRDGVPPVLGETFDEKRDGARLGAQFCRVRTLMEDGQWRTLSEIALETADPEASISARLRDLRRAGYRVDRRRRTYGTHEYRVHRKP